jgi:cell division protein FtsB
MASPTTDLKPNALKKRIRKILRKPKLLLLSSVLVVLTATLLFANKGIWRHVSLKSEISELQEVEAQMAVEEAHLKKQVGLLKSEDAATIERVARERYNMKKDGEIIYRLEKKK